MKGLILVMVGVGLCADACDRAPATFEFALGLVVLILGLLLLPSERQVRHVPRLGCRTGATIGLDHRL